MKISYAITVCNEFVEIQRLLGFLLKNKRDQDEIVILFDTNNGTKEVEQVLDHYNSIFKYYEKSKKLAQSHLCNAIIVEVLMIGNKCEHILAKTII